MESSFLELKQRFVTYSGSLNWFNSLLIQIKQQVKTVVQPKEGFGGQTPSRAEKNIRTNKCILWNSRLQSTINGAVGCITSYGF